MAPCWKYCNTSKLSVSLTKLSRLWDIHPAFKHLVTGVFCLFYTCKHNLDRDRYLKRQYNVCISANGSEFWNKQGFLDSYRSSMAVLSSNTELFDTSKENKSWIILARLSKLCVAMCSNTHWWVWVNFFSCHIFNRNKMISFNMKIDFSALRILR